MSRALRVLSHRSAVPEPGAGEGSRQGKKCPDPRPQGSCQPTCARGRIQPGHTHTSMPGTRPCRAQQCHRRGVNTFPPRRQSMSLPKGSSFGSSFLLVSILHTAGLGTPAAPQLRRPQKRGKRSHYRAAPGDSPSPLPLEQPRRAEPAAYG